MRRFILSVLISVAALSVYGQQIPDRVITLPVPSGGVNKNKQSDRYSSITAYNRFFLPKFSNNIAFLAAGGKDSTSIYWNTTINRVIISKQGGGYDTLSTSSASTYTAGYGLTLVGNKFAADTSASDALVGKPRLSALNASLVHRTGPETVAGQKTLLDNLVIQDGKGIIFDGSSEPNILHTTGALRIKGGINGFRLTKENGSTALLMDANGDFTTPNIINSEKRFTLSNSSGVVGILYRDTNSVNLQATSLSDGLRIGTTAASPLMFYQNGDPQMSIFDNTVSVVTDMYVGGRASSPTAPVNPNDLVNLQYLSNNFLRLSGGTLTGDIQLYSSTPTNSLSAVPKSYVDNLITGITWKNAARVATLVNIALSGTGTIDGVVLAVGNRVLVKNQTNPAQNGIYIVSAGAWSRAADADSADEINTATIAVTLGNTQKNTQWTSTSTITTVGSDPITFGQISGAGTYSAGTNLTLTGNVFSVVGNPSFSGDVTAPNLVYNNGSYANPSWITSLAFSKITGYTVPTLQQVTTSGNTTADAINVPIINIRETAGFGVGMKIDNRNATQQYAFAVDASVVDDGMFSILDMTAGQVPRFSIEKTTGNILSYASIRAAANDGNSNSVVRNVDLPANFPPSAASSATLVNNANYTFNGTTATYTLPTVASGKLGDRVFIMNMGSGMITVNSNSGGNDIYNAGALTNSLNINVGEIAVFYNNGINFFRQL